MAEVVKIEDYRQPEEKKGWLKVQEHLYLTLVKQRTDPEPKGMGKAKMFMGMLEDEKAQLWHAGYPFVCSHMGCLNEPKWAADVEKELCVFYCVDHSPLLVDEALKDYVRLTAHAKGE